MKNTVKVVLWLAELANELKNSLEDGKMKWGEILALSDNLFELKSVVPALSKMYGELKDASNEDQQLVLQEVSAKLDVDNDKAEEIVINSINLGMSLIKMIETVRK